MEAAATNAKRRRNAAALEYINTNWVYDHTVYWGRRGGEMGGAKRRAGEQGSKGSSKEGG
jgi:hypothetical protein